MNRLNANRTDFGSVAVCCTLALVLLVITSCSESNNFVTDVKVKTYETSGDSFGEVDVSLNSGNLIFPSLTVPILNPSDPAQLLGQVSLKPLIGDSGLSHLKIAVNLSQVGHVPSFDGRLPNGTLIPISGLENATLIGIPVRHGIIVYLAFGNGSAMIGAAIPINEMGSIGRGGLCPANVFFPFQSEGIKAIAGPYIGCGLGESGLGVFVDVSEAFFNSEMATVHSLSQNTGNITLKPSTLKGRNGKFLERKLYRFGKKKRYLSLY